MEPIKRPEGQPPSQPKTPQPTPLSAPVSNQAPNLQTASTFPASPIEQPQAAQQSPGLKIKSGNGWWPQISGVASFVVFIGGVLLAAFLINHFIFQSYFVEGTSMVPTLHDKDRLIIEKVGRTTSNIQGKLYTPSRGDIVVLDSTLVDFRGSSEQLIKRVIGLPGESIVIENGTVTVKNQQEPSGFNVDERLGLDLEPTFSSQRQQFEVPEGSIFVMGDNRTQNGSHDSRSFGAVPSSNLEGSLWARIFPVDQARLFP